MRGPLEEKRSWFEPRDDEPRRVSPTPADIRLARSVLAGEAIDPGDRGLVQMTLEHLDLSERSVLELRSSPQLDAAAHRLLARRIARARTRL